MQIPSELLAAAKAEFFNRGESVAEWARANNFRPELVYAVLDGRAKASRGNSHLIAVKLGLKRAPSLSAPASSMEVNDK